MNPSPALALSLASQRSLLSLCSTPVVDSAAATSFVSRTPRNSGFFAATLPRPDADANHVVDQALAVAEDSGRPQFVWSDASSEVGLACWQRGLPPVNPLALMVHQPCADAPTLETPAGTDIVVVRDHDAAELFRAVHLAQFRRAPDPIGTVDHFAGDHVLLDPSVHAVVVRAGDEPSAVGYLHTAAEVSGIYWVATDEHHRRRGLGGVVTAALLAAAPRDRPVVLQATALGRPVYLRHGFQDRGLVWCWQAG